MTDQRLYIDGILMDVSEDMEVTLDIKSNLFRDVTKITSNNTYTINLPKTVHNMSAIDWAAKPKSGSRYPFVFHKARYIRNGLEIIKDGRATLLSIGDDIEISIYWGLFPAFADLQESDIKLNELKTTEHIQFNKTNEAFEYSKALEAQVFYANYETAQVRSSSDDWVGNDRTEGSNTTKTYELVNGKIKTGTATGAHISGTIEADEEYKCAIINFTAGMTASMDRVLGGGDYRTYAVLDKNMNVVELAEDNSSKEYNTMGTIPVIDELSQSAQAGDIVANISTVSMSVVEITLRLPDNNPAGTIEYGTLDPSTWETEKWGELAIDANAGEYASAKIAKFKAEGLVVYLKPSVDGLLYAGISVSTASYWNRQETSAKWLYNVKYTSDNQPYKLSVQAPASAEWLVINTTTKYNTSTRLTITTSIEGKAARKEAKATGFGSLNTRATSGPIQPSVSCQYVLDLITQQTGVEFVWSASASDYIKKLAIPLVTRKADAKTLDGGIAADIQNTNEIGTLGFLLTKTADTIFNETEKGRRYEQLTAKVDCTMTFDVQMIWSWDASTAKPQGHRNWSFDGAEASEAFYTYPPCYIEMKVVSRHTSDQEESEYTKTYIAGTQSQMDDGYYAMISDSETSKVNGRFIHLITGYGAVELEEGDIVTFEMKNQTGRRLKGLRCYNGTIKATLKADENVPYGGNFPIGINLPDIKVTDFLKFLQLVTAVFPRQSFAGAISFQDLSQLWDGRGKAVDWTRKLVASEGRNIPRTSEYSIDGYCQHNVYKWKEDETVYEKHDSDMIVDNGTLDYTQDAWTIPFAASDGNRVPIYGWKSSTSTFGRTSFTSSYATEYKACKDRIMNLVNVNEVANLRFDIDLQAIFDTKYKQLRKSLSSAHVIKERFLLSSLEVLEFDETKPVYLAQYGAYFAVTELKTTTNGYVEATMFQLEF